MGNFINTSLTDTVNELNAGAVDAFVKNPYYVFGASSKATIVTFYEIDQKNSTLDEATRTIDTPIGSNSPMRFKKIRGVYLFGIEKIELQLQKGDFGLESAGVTGDVLDLPGTLTPIPGCYFEIDYVNKKSAGHYLFQITDVTEDTLDDGANTHKMMYQLERTSDKAWNDLQAQVTGEYNFVVSNFGKSNMSCVIEKDSYELARQLDIAAITLKDLYVDLFYDTRVQSFVYRSQIENLIMYDDYLIEFMIRTGVLKNNGGKYNSVQHQLPIRGTFGVSYMNSIFRAVETLNADNIQKSKRRYTVYMIDDQHSIFFSRSEIYNRCDYDAERIIGIGLVDDVYDDETILSLASGTKFDKYDARAILNVLVSAISGEIITKNDIESIDNVQYTDSKVLYYGIPMAIYAIETNVKKLLAEHVIN